MLDETWDRWAGWERASDRPVRVNAGRYSPERDGFHIKDAGPGLQVLLRIDRVTKEVLSVAGGALDWGADWIAGLGLSFQPACPETPLNGGLVPASVTDQGFCDDERVTETEVSNRAHNFL